MKNRVLPITKLFVLRPFHPSNWKLIDEIKEFF